MAKGNRKGGRGKREKKKKKKKKKRIGKYICKE
jgi:hypothetical protein